jgi:hypothetical protein
MSTATAEHRVGGAALPGKIPRHLERLAVVYVRQSTAHQVLHHRESTRLQYDLTKQAIALGWSAERILVIDDDLGCSARGANAGGSPPGGQGMGVYPGPSHPTSAVRVVAGAGGSNLLKLVNPGGRPPRNY